MASDKINGAGRTEAYINHLKALYGVGEDQELAKALGSTKSAIAKWRARDTIPASIENKVSKQFGGQHFWWVVEDSVYRRRWEEDAYSVVLHIMEHEVLPSWSEHTVADPIADISLRGMIFKELLEAIRLHIQKYYPDLDASILGAMGAGILERCLADYDAGRIDGIDEAISPVLFRPG